MKLVSLACLILCHPTAFGIGFGEVKVRSNLGEVLRLQVSLSGASDDVLVPSCVHPKIETLDGELIDIPRIEFMLPGQPNAPVLINLVSKKNMVEPALRFSIAMTCGAVVQRDYSLLLDFVDTSNQLPLALATIPAPVPRVSSLPAKSGAAATTVIKRPPVLRSPVAGAVKAGTPVNKPGLDALLHDSPQPKAGRDVLRVDSNAEVDLKMSSSLTQMGLSEPDQQRLQANRQAQAQFAALLRGEDPVNASQQQLSQEQLKSKALETRLRQLSSEDARKDEQAKGLSPMVIGLGSVVVALLLALLAVVGFTMRRSSLNRHSRWWDATIEHKHPVENIVDALEPNVDRGELDPNTITSVKVALDQDSVPSITSPENTVLQSQPRPLRDELPALEDSNSSTFNFFGNRGQSIHIEEISDITQEAEFWMSVNDPHRAIEILEPQSVDDFPQTPITWLYLLDLYRLVGDEDKYLQLRKRFKGKFNARIPDFGEEVIASPVRSFEDFPHLVAKCCAVWNTEEISGYLESLLIDNREGDRLGFDLPVYRDILFLLTLSNDVRRFEQKQSALVARSTTDQAGNAPDEVPDTLNFGMLEFTPRHPSRS